MSATETKTTGDSPLVALKEEPEESWLTPGRFALLLGVLIGATFPGILLGSATFIIRDFGLFSYPVAYFQRESFWQGEWPLWNPLSECGVPFLAQWNTLVLYPFSLLYLLLPLTWSLSIFCLAHLFWGGLGAYFLAQRWTQYRLAAALAGIIFSFNGLALNFLMWPSHIATFAWMPWVLWLVPEGWREGGTKAVWATLAAAMQMLAGGPETLALTWLILFLLAVGDWIRLPARRLRIVSGFAAIGVLVALLCAAQLLPFLELLAHSQRDTGFGSSVWSMPLWGWANFLVPLFHTSPTTQGVFFQGGQSWTSSYYAGIGTVLLAAAAVRRARDWRVGLLAVLVGAGLILALGDSGLLYRALRFCAPVLGFVRYPVKFVILVLALAPLLAAFGLAALAKRPQRMGTFEQAVAAVLLLLTGIILWFGWKFPLRTDVWAKTWQNGLSRAAFLVVIFLLTAALLKSRERRRILFGFLLLAVFWLDLVTHMPTQNPTAHASVYTPGWAAARLKWEPRPRLGQSRAMLAPAAQEALKYHVISSPEQNYLLNRLALLADCNLLDGTPQVHGFFSLLPWQANNVIALPYVQTNRPFPALLDFLGVSQLTSPTNVFEFEPRPAAMPIITAGQQPVFADDQAAFSAFFQTNSDFRQTVFLPQEARAAISANRQLSAQVRVSGFTSQKISFQTEAPGPCVTVVAQSFYPAWKAFVDDRPVKLWRANYGFQAIEVPAGRHQVRLVYQDKTFHVGLMLSLLGFLACCSLGLLSHFRRS